jgi:hypothetical protein
MKETARSNKMLEEMSGTLHSHLFIGQLFVNTSFIFTPTLSSEKKKGMQGLKTRLDPTITMNLGQGRGF